MSLPPPMWLHDDYLDDRPGDRKPVKCYNCQNNIPFDALFCPRCGSVNTELSIPEKQQIVNHVNSGKATIEERRYVEETFKAVRDAERELRWAGRTPLQAIIEHGVWLFVGIIIVIGVYSITSAIFPGMEICLSILVAGLLLFFGPFRVFKK